LFFLLALILPVETTTKERQIQKDSIRFLKVETNKYHLPLTLKNLIYERVTLAVLEMRIRNNSITRIRIATAVINNSSNRKKNA
jgi:hypothetical protein